MALFTKNEVQPTDEARAHRRRLVDDMVFEIIPLKTSEAAIAALPPNARVSITASPVKGLDATMELAEAVRAAGHRPVPHISARLVENSTHIGRLARWFKDDGFDTIFVVAGDIEEALGPYEGAYAFMQDLFALDHGLHTVGIPAYPDGHAFIPAGIVREQLHKKQELITEAGLGGWASTQMCFDTDLTASWLRAERDDGFLLPVHLGIPGVVDRAKLMTMGVRLGVGASLRYLKKNRAVVSKLLSPGSYDPDDILKPMVNELESLNVSALHVFTFNQVEATEAWRQETLAE